MNHLRDFQDLTIHDVPAHPSRQSGKKAPYYTYNGRGCVKSLKRRLHGTCPQTRVGVAQLLHRNVQRFRGGLVFKAHRLVHHLTLSLRVTKTKRKSRRRIRHHHHPVQPARESSPPRSSALGSSGEPRCSGLESSGVEDGVRAVTQLILVLDRKELCALSPKETERLSVLRAQVIRSRGPGVEDREEAVPWLEGRASVQGYLAHKK